MNNRYYLMIILILLPLTSYAVDIDYCKTKKLGWHFYCDDEKGEQLEQSPKVKTVTKEEALGELKQIQADLEAKKALAVLYPTPQNIRDYISFQRQQLDRASLFTDGWRRALWQNPDLDYTLQRPVATLAKQTWIDDRKVKKKNTAIHLNERYGIFFFYRSDCVYCHKYSPVLKLFSEKYNLDVIAVSMDGKFLKEWPDSVINKGQAQRLGMVGKGVPATILFDNQTKEIITVGFGFMAFGQLEERIYLLTQVEIGDDF